MENLTEQQLFELSEQFKALAVSLFNYHFTHMNTLSFEESQSIQNQAMALLNKSFELNAASVLIELEDAEKTVQRIQNVTERIQTTLSVITNAEKIIEIATAAVALSFSVLSGNVNGIKESIKSIVELTNVMGE